MPQIMIDTHIVVWLYTNELGKISGAGQQAIEDNEILISPIVLLELQYLFEINKVLVSAEEIYQDLHHRIGLKLEQNILWNRVIKESLHLGWTRDPFDRLIVAHSKILDCSIVTKDRVIQINYQKIIW